MDASNFSVQLDLANSNLLKVIEDQLLQTDTEDKYIRAELYKLNIYGKSCHVLPTLSLHLISFHVSRERLVLQGT